MYKFPCPHEPKHIEWPSSSPFPADHVLELCSSDTHTCSHGNISDIRMHLTTDGGPEFDRCVQDDGLDYDPAKSLCYSPNLQYIRMCLCLETGSLKG